jgi:hypothetical protein
LNIYSRRTRDSTIIALWCVIQLTHVASRGAEVGAETGLYDFPDGEVFFSGDQKKL